MRTSGGVMLRMEYTYRSGLTNEFLEGVLLNERVLALTDSGILGSASWQNALSKGFSDGSPRSLIWQVSLEISA